MKSKDNLTMEERFSILNIEVKTQSSTHQVNLGEDLLIEPEHMNEAFIEQPAKFAYWATVALQAKSLVDKKKLEVDKQEDYLKKMHLITWYLQVIRERRRRVLQDYLQKYLRKKVFFQLATLSKLVGLTLSVKLSVKQHHL